MILTPSTEFLDFTWLDESSPSSDGGPTPKPKTAKEKVFRTRRSHTKSRNGCINCKSRRIKCDERKPECDQCLRHNISCHYVPPKNAMGAKKYDSVNKISPSTYDPSFPWLSTKPAAMSIRLTTDHMAKILYPHQPEQYSASRGLVHTLQHFETTAYKTLGSPAHQWVMQKYALSLSQNAPFLLHAIFAFSARHLQILKPEIPKHAAEAAYHRSRALELFSNQAKISNITSEMDAWFTGFIMLCALAFHQEADKSDVFHHSQPLVQLSFLWNPEASDEWLNIVSFLSNLLRLPNLKSHIRHSVWLPVVEDIDDEINSFTDNRPGPIGLPPLFVDLCGITEYSNGTNNPYHAALRILAPMMRIRASIENFSKLISFACRMPPAFIDLYRAKDAAALLIMCYWFSQMSDVEHWWCKARARTECWAICNHLDGWPDARVQALLRYPKEKCGYVGIDMDAIQTCVFGM